MKKAIGPALALTLISSSAFAQDYTQQELADATQTTLDLQAGGCQPIVDKLFVNGKHEIGQDMANCLMTIANEMSELYQSVKPQVATGTKLYNVDPNIAGKANGQIMNQCDAVRDNIKEIAPNLSGQSGLMRFMDLVGNYVDGCSETLSLVKDAANERGIGDFEMNAGSNDMIRLFSYCARGWESKPHREACETFIRAQQNGQPVELGIVPNPEIKIPTIK